VSKLRDLAVEEGRSSVFPTLESMYQVGTRAITGCYHLCENCAKEVDKVFQMPMNYI